MLSSRDGMRIAFVTGKIDAFYAARFLAGERLSHARRRRRDERRRHAFGHAPRHGAEAATLRFRWRRQRVLSAAAAKRRQRHSYIFTMPAPRPRRRHADDTDSQIRRLARQGAASGSLMSRKSSGRAGLTAAAALFSSVATGRQHAACRQSRR